jgi:glycerol-3-phosphate dehydrogenase (NAD(P)+)
MASGLMQQLACAGITLELTSDAIGAQVGGALKNMIAIACGMAMAQGMGENARAGIVTRGIDDMRRLTLAMGGRIETLLGSSGVGDLFLTAASGRSRNTRLGMRLGQPGAVGAGEAAELAEGAVSVMSVQILERELGLRLNVAAAVRAVLQQRLSAGEALQWLLHDSVPDMLPTVVRMPRLRAFKPAAGRSSDAARPAEQSASLGCA